MLDINSGADVTIGLEHHNVHEKCSFKIDDVQEVNIATQKWMVTTPDSKKYAHMIFDVLCTGEISVVVTEGADRIGTTVLTSINRNRIGTPPDATTTIHRNVSGGTTDGTTPPIKNVRFGATDKFSGAVSKLRGQNEYVLKPNTKYLITATTYANVFATLHLDWYEQKDRRMQEHFNVE